MTFGSFLIVSIKFVHIRNAQSYWFFTCPVNAREADEILKHLQLFSNSLPFHVSLAALPLSEARLNATVVSWRPL